MPDGIPRKMWAWPSGWDFPSNKIFLFDLRIQYSHVVPSVRRKRKAPPPDATTAAQLEDASDLYGVQLPDESERYGVQLPDESELYGVQLPDESKLCGVELPDESDLEDECARAIEDKSCGTSKRKAPSSDATCGVQLPGESDLEGVCARAVEGKSCGTSKRKAPSPDATSSVQLPDKSDLEGGCARAVEDKSSGTSKRKAPSLDTTSGVQLPDVSNLEGVCARAVEDKSSGTSKRKAPFPDTTSGVQLADVYARDVKHKSSGTSKRKAPPADTFTGVLHADASDRKGVYARAIKHKSSGTIIGYKYEPRFTPPREKVHDGTTRKINRLYLGEYDKCDEAKIMLQIARFYYDKDHGCVELDDGQFKFFIPPMNEQERQLAGEEKRKLVISKAKQVFADLGIQRQNLEQLCLGDGADACFSHDKDIEVSEIPSVSFANVLEVPSCPPPLASCTIPDALEVPSCPGPLSPSEVVGALEVPSRPAPLPPCNIADDYGETFSGFSDMIDDLQCFDSTNFFPQQSSLNCEMRYLGFGQILGDSSSPQADDVTQFTQGSIDTHLIPRIDFQQGWDLVGTSGSNFFAKQRDPVLQQLVQCQKQQLEVYALQIVGLEHQLCESRIQISELQQEIERLTSQLLNGSLI